MMLWRAKLVVCSLLAALAAVAAGGVASAQPADPLLLANLAEEAKLLRATEILAPFQAGDAQRSVIVTLRPSAAANALAAQSRRSVQAPPGFAAPGAPPFYNLQDRKLRRELRATVEETVAAATARLAGDGLEVTHRFSYQFAFAARVTPAALKRLVDDPEVVAVEQAHVLKPHLAQGIPLMGAAAPRAGHDGSGMSIAICDTGIDTSHPRLGNGGSSIFNAKVIGGYDTGDNDADPRPDPSFGNAHGTACAGIAAGDLGTVGDYIGGVAPGAKLYAIKISAGTTGNATEPAMIAGWEWAITHQDDDPNNPILVISTSFGGGGATSACDADVPTMTAAAANAVAAGITLFASSGNDGYCNMVAWPACISHVNSVGAVYDANIGSNVGWCVDGDSCAPKVASGCPTGWAAYDATTAADRVPVYSNSASFLTLFAPSNNASTADIVGAGGYDPGDYDTTFGGTSAASPYAAGAAGVLQGAAKDILGAYLTPAQVRQYLVGNGDSVTDPKVAVTRPRVDLERAVNALGFPLTVRKIGRGTVTSSPAGINCGSDCSHDYTPGTPVTLTVAEYPGVPFLGWSGEGCSGTGTCDVLMDRARTVTAAFASFPWTMFLPGITANSGPPPGPATYWSAFSYVYCPTSEATFSLTSAGVTKNSVMPAGGNAGRGGTFEGWVQTAPGSKSFTWRLATATCGTWNGNFSYALLDGKNYMFYLDLNASNQPVVYVYVNNGDPTAAQGPPAPEIGNAGAQANSGMLLVEEIPLDIPARIFKRAQTAR